MTTRTFVSWVQQPAEQLREGRSEIARTARQLLPEHWLLPSPLDGWTYKDLLAHLASGDWVFQTMLRQTLGVEKQLPAQATLEFVNDGNAKRLAERKDSNVEELITEAEREGETTQELLSGLTDAHDPAAVVWLRPNGDPVTLQQWVTGFPQHDPSHLAQLRMALDQVMM
jgi:uncharacterized damage-inducible protein DinB